MTQEEIGDQHYGLYQAVSAKYNELVREGKEKTEVGVGFAKEVDYWFNRLPQEKRKKLLTEAKAELVKAFESAFSKAYPANE